jgi:hypothetical protein
MRAISSLEGKKLIVAKAMQIAPNKYLNVGEDVTEMMKDSPALWTNLKRGHIQIVDFVQTKAQAKSEVVFAEIVQLDV